MAENVKGVLLIGNSRFSFTEDDRNVNVEADCQNKNEAKPFNTITVTTLSGDGEQSEFMSHCNYGQFNCMNPEITYYLNGTNIHNNDASSVLKSPPQRWDAGIDLTTDNIENFPFFSGNAPIDFPFLNSTTANKIQVDEGLQYLNILNSNIEVDVPDYIDIDTLVIPDSYQGCCQEENGGYGTCFKQNSVTKQNDVDDDVVFVKEYKQDEPVDTLPVVKKEVKDMPEPRRNPKRQVQLQKMSYELASKMSYEGYYDSRRKYNKETTTTKPKKSTKTVGAIFSPAAPLKPTDYKEWPANGMHEKPSFNPVTKKLEKLPDVPKKTKPNPIKPTQTQNRKKPLKRKRTKEENEGVKKEFASLTHNTFHHVLSYVEQLKEFNNFNKNSENEDVINNLEKAEDILMDSCILYSLTNATNETCLSQYINSIKSNANSAQFINTVIEECNEKSN